MKELGEDLAMTRHTGTVTPARPIYLDHHATTPVDPRVANVVLRTMTEVFGNANSVDHVFGEAAAELIVAAAESVAVLVGATPDDVRFTSGSTEALRLAVAHAAAARGGKTFRIAVSRVEHKAVLNAIASAARDGACQVTWIEVDSRARILQSSLESALERGVDLLCLMAANNEVGTVNPIEDVA